MAALGCHGAGFLMRDLSDMSKFRLSHWVQAHLSVIFYSILPIALTVRSTKFDFFKSSLVFSPGHPDMAPVRPIHQPPGGTSCRFWHGSTFRVGTSSIACFLMLLWYNHVISFLRHCEETNPADCRWGYAPGLGSFFNIFHILHFTCFQVGLAPGLGSLCPPPHPDPPRSSAPDRLDKTRSAFHHGEWLAFNDGPQYV